MLTRSGEVKLVDFATMRDSVESGGLAESVKVDFLPFCFALSYFVFAGNACLHGS
jgi:hypothetical protein